MEEVMTVFVSRAELVHDKCHFCRQTKHK